MRTHDRILQRFRSIWVSKPSINIRFSQAVIDEIEDLIEIGKYASYSDFVNRAVSELLTWERTKEIRMKMILEAMQTEEGRKLLREILDDSG